MKILLMFLSCAATVLLGGCIENIYARFYVPVETPSSVSPSKKENVSVRFLDDMSCIDEKKAEILESGYEMVGYSAFLGLHCPWSAAIDHAQNVGADLILICEEYEKTETLTGVDFIPMTSVSQTSGSVSMSGFNSYSTGTYNATTTTTSVAAVPYVQKIDIYRCNALFFRKLQQADGYGVRFDCAQDLLPGDSLDDKITVRIIAVLKGSKAQMDGLKRGDVVWKINGKEIKTRRDLAPFLNGYSIHKVEVKK